MMTTAPSFVRLDGEALTILFAAPVGGAPDLVYLGPRLGSRDDARSIACAARFGRHESQAEIAPVAGLWPQHGRGFLGTAAAILRRGDRQIATGFGLTDVKEDERGIAFILADAAGELELRLDWRIAAGDVVRASAMLTNRGAKPLAVDQMASLVLPLPDWAAALTRFSGRWAGEMRMETRGISPGAISDAASGGKPGFGGGNWLIAGEADAGADQGRMIGAHLAWSGGYASLVEHDADGATRLQLGSRIAPGEIILGPGQGFRTPDAVFAFSGAGRNGLRRAFHAHLRQDVLPARAGWGPRKVHLNSWDALGFDIDEAKAMALADGGAAVGVERFVLDDGWFRGRRDDRSSLGDWSPDPARFPRGLDPLIAHVAGLGMDFGLWVEPEMVSPNSDLHRAHPDWCLQLSGGDRPTQRSQLVLDLSRAAVVDHLFEMLDRLLSTHAIAYLKWDHNRDLFPLANDDGAVGHAQTLAFYALLDRLRTAHPGVEIESCSSGGGRVDFEVLRRCHRVWASDNNDPIERLHINDAWSIFLPPEVIGAHVGPSPNPVTGRSAPMAFRAAVATFAHLGVEADPSCMRDGDRAVLAAAIARYKDWRELLHDGELRELTIDTPGVRGSLVAGRGGQALALVASTAFAATFNARRVRLPGFDADAHYRVRLLDPWPAKAAHYLNDPAGWRDGHALSGRALAEVGLAIPLSHPDTAWLIAIEPVEAA